MIAAVIVTYNRKELLGENIQMLLKQTYPFDQIIIVDNCSTDGTDEYLQKNGWKNSNQFVYIKLSQILVELEVSIQAAK